MRRVITEHSIYELDGDTLRRVAVAPEAATLRCDGDSVELIEVLTLEEGRSAAFLIQLPNVDGPTIRQTTPVRLIVE